jgi:hypothetical protein
MDWQTRRRIKMNKASYGETSGFTPVTVNEQTAVNGGGVQGCYRNPLKELVTMLAYLTTSGGK